MRPLIVCKDRWLDLRRGREASLICISRTRYHVKGLWYGGQPANPLYCTIPPRHDELAIPWLGGFGALDGPRTVQYHGSSTSICSRSQHPRLGCVVASQDILPSSQLTVALRIYLMCSAALVPFQFYRRQSVALIFRLGSLTALDTFGSPFLLAASTCDERPPYRWLDGICDCKSPSRPKSAQ